MWDSIHWEQQQEEDVEDQVFDKIMYEYARDFHLEKNSGYGYDYP